MPRVKKYDKYLDPQDLENISREEIASHSSLLTNRRLDVMFLSLDKARFEAWNNTCVPTVKEYFSIISGIHNNVFAIFTIGENTEIKKSFDLYHTLFKLLLNKSTKNKYSVCYEILLQLDQLQRLIIGYLQARQFFFRLGRKQIKGIHQALKLYEKRALAKKKKKRNV